MSVIEMAGAVRRYGSGEGEVRAVDRASLTVGRGEFVAIEGPSGSGKTTLLGLLAGLEPPDEGRVEVLGHDLAALSAADRAKLRRTRIGIVFQAFGLVPSLDALENVALPLRLGGVTPDEAAERATRALGAVDLGDRGRHRVDELSGGERQRVGVARAIAIAPAVILADEPTGNLDERNGRAVVELLAARAGANGTAIVLVTHDPLSAAMAQRRYAMRDGVLSEAAS
jgi:putative ABC transport system ATP-binding protein